MRKNTRLERRVLPDNLLHSSFIRRAILLEEIVCVGLCGGFRVGIVKQVLDTQQNLFNGDCRLPGFFFVQNREADSAGGVDVGVEERRDEFAWSWLEITST